MSAAIECIVPAEAQQVFWCFNDKKLSHSYKYTIYGDRKGMGILTINDLTKEDTGKYSCFYDDEDLCMLYHINNKAYILKVMCEYYVVDPYMFSTLNRAN